MYHQFWQQRVAPNGKPKNNNHLIEGKPAVKLSVILLAVILTFILIQPAHAMEFWDGKVKATGYLAQHWQSLEADPPARPEAQDTTSGFSRIRMSIGLAITVSERISAFIELSEEPNDFEGTEFGQVSNDIAFLTIKAQPWLSLNVGNIVTTLHNYIPYSDGAVVQGNPLIGNSPIDFITAEEGVQLVGSHGTGDGFLKNFGWDIALTNPRFFEEGGFGKDQPYQIFGKVRFSFDHGLSIGAGIFFCDGADQFNSGGGNGVPSVGNGPVSAVFIGDGDNYNLPGTATSSRETHSGLIPGIDVFMWQIDAKWAAPGLPLMIRGWAGIAEDDWRYVNGAGNQTTLAFAADVIEDEATQNFFGLEVKFDFNEQLYAAARYSFTENDSSGTSGNTDLDRIQIGAGWWFNKVALLKIEYVQQNEDAQGPGQVGGDWGGVVSELSVSF